MFSRKVKIEYLNSLLILIKYQRSHNHENFRVKVFLYKTLLR